VPKVGVFAAIFDLNNRILCAKLNYGSGNWTLPGGHLEINESPYDGIKREVFEETGYIIDIENLISVYSAPQRMILYYYLRHALKVRLIGNPIMKYSKLNSLREMLYQVKFMNGI
jgi:8-oxo-dGTP diphosphatase